ncbi:GSCOCG00011363001-RA-CDS [Cotesia congregata]|nr:GSCOCG00011363001-RA-CDS [Cotesia congregata]
MKNGVVVGSFPLLRMTTGDIGASFTSVFVCSILKICMPSSQGVATVVMKNWQPFVFFPALAMLMNPGPI